MEVRLSFILVYLTGSSVCPTSTNSIYGPLGVSLVAPDVLTVNIPVSLFCFSRCSPACSFSISAGERSADASQLVFILTHRLPHMSVSCTARNNATGRAATTSKTLRVTQGPEKVAVSGPASLAVGQSHRFQCSALCWPACNYTWSSDGLPLSASGNELFLTPSPAVAIETLLCKATNSVTGIFASAVRELYVTDGPVHTVIRGPDAVDVESSATFQCLTVCKPSCNFIWTIEDQTQQGPVIQVVVLKRQESLTLSCTATNTLTNATGVAHKTLRVTGNASAGLQLNLLAAFLAGLIHLTGHTFTQTMQK